MTAIYFAQKTREAVNELVFSDESLRRRLHSARFCLYPLISDQINDEDIRDRLESITNKIDSGDIPDNFDLVHMTEDEVSKTIKDLLFLYEKCIIYLEKTGYFG